MWKLFVAFVISWYVKHLTNGCSFSLIFLMLRSQDRRKNEEISSNIGDLGFLQRIFESSSSILLQLFESSSQISNTVLGDGLFIFNSISFSSDENEFFSDQLLLDWRSKSNKLTPKVTFFFLVETLLNWWIYLFIYLDRVQS